MKELPLCPHCKGQLFEAGDFVKWQYGCSRCGRAWIVLDNIYWLAGFDAAGHIYKVEGDKIDEVREMNPLWKQLWDRVEDL